MDNKVDIVESVELAKEHARAAPWEQWRAMLAASETKRFALDFVAYAKNVAMRAQGAETARPMLCGFALWRGLDEMLGNPTLAQMTLSESDLDLPSKISKSLAVRVMAIKTSVRISQKKLCKEAVSASEFTLFEAWYVERASGLLTRMAMEICSLRGAKVAINELGKVKDIAPEWVVEPWVEVMRHAADLLASPSGVRRDVRLDYLREEPGVWALWSGFDDGGVEAGHELGERVLFSLDILEPADIEALIDGLAREALEFAGGSDSLAGRAMCKAWMSSMEGEALLWGAGLHPNPMVAAKKILMFGSESMPTGRIGRAISIRWRSAAVACVEQEELEGIGSRLLMTSGNALRM